MSRETSEHPVEGNGLLPLNDLLSPADDQQSTPGPQAKRPRNFIATVACETCRLKKTRCDESRPRCGLCKSLDLECVYNERKSSKRDQSLSMIMSTLHRLETKMESIPSAVCQDMQPFQDRLLQSLRTFNGSRDLDLQALTAAAAAAAGTSNGNGSSSSNTNNRPVVSIMRHQAVTPALDSPGHFDVDDQYHSQKQQQGASVSTGHVAISFSQHGVINWSGVRSILPERVLAAYETLGRNYVIDVEKKRLPLPMHIRPFPSQAGERWLEVLPLALIKGLSDAFFTTFNPFTPIMDKNFYFSFTLGAAIESGFGCTMESCLVLNVMALGCLAVLAHREGNYPLPGSHILHFEPPDWMSVVHEEPAGLRFFNEARRRIGFLMCENDLQSCQFYLLSSVYYSQILRPMDWWAMNHRAATCCLSMFTNQDVNFDQWEGDMKSRVFWSCLMNESILVQELPLPPSGLLRLEETVPIPKFISFETTGFGSARFPSSGDLDDSFFQYHFLAQVAHRIILNRIRHSLYFFSSSGTFPLPAITAELHHQLEQWRVNLPPALQFPDPFFAATTPRSTAAASPIPTPTARNPPLLLRLDSSTSITSTSSPSPSSSSTSPPSSSPHTPATAVAEAMLRGRYTIGKFHIGRPYLYKALHAPDVLTDHDLDQVRSGLRAAMDWPITQGIFRSMKSCIPIKFAFCSQFFGQILLFHCIAQSPNARVRDTLPLGWERWNAEMLHFLDECALFSPAIAQDLDILRLMIP
ncbi:hypothetical protein ASPZODRAFT_60389 [Penicilliopsis zonata CBS 506.65]|uniref:Zn(2)-C6 fungal-type domain-containing protein n=1 Tax=Penicilliopsis zonata CBS 506.65 TaxID=1073090 RepID=A0A1L9SP34_9EURO|nr:hypothetical protein ASPZODRAFT_60389 [Penicilliopsis zonata CBS 506.65]OJJ48863.1 hypothetical protein ASPZODRAFT_60389 [Penicilliopsis zonata CBS 506.65]